MTNFGTGTIWKWILAHILPFLLPEAAAADAGKVVSVNSEGEYALTEPETFNGGVVDNMTTFDGSTIFNEEALFTDEAHFEDEVRIDGDVRIAGDTLFSGEVSSLAEYTPPSSPNVYVTKQYVDSKDPVNLEIVLPVGDYNDTVTLNAATLAKLNKNVGKCVRARLNKTINNSGPQLTFESRFNMGVGAGLGALSLLATALDTINPVDYVTMNYSYDENGIITNISFTYQRAITYATSVFITREECSEISPAIDT